MTCIVGLETDDGAWIGADCAANANGTIIRITRRGKIERVGDLLFASAGLHRTHQVLRNQLELPEHEVGADPDDYVAKPLLDAMASALKEYLDMPVNDETPDADPRNDALLIAYRGRIYQTECHRWSLVIPILGYVAIGSGAPYALGSLFSTTSLADPRKRIEMALNAAQEFDGGVRGPFAIMKSAPAGVIHQEGGTSFTDKINVLVGASQSSSVSYLSPYSRRIAMQR